MQLILEKKTMKKFKQKEYTIQEGHYTGPKDLEKIPGTFEVIGKSALAGTAIGGVVGGILDKSGVDGASISEGMATGGKTGFVAGILSKYLLNALHKPMKTVKFQEVDKLLRAKFGIYRVSGFMAGDTYQKRKTVEEKFAVNSRAVTDFKISFCIQDNKVTMYTLGITDEDLEKLNSSLDYYCKKFQGMSYTAKPINAKENSYSVSLTFTNYKAISDFIFEVSEVLGYRINLMNDNVLLETAVAKNFSISIDKYDLQRVLGSAAGKSIGFAAFGPKMLWSALVSNAIHDGLMKMSRQEAAKYFPARRKDLGTPFLEDRLKRLGYIEGVHYTKDLKDRECNIRLDQGIFLVTTLQRSKPDLLLGKILPDERRKEVTGKVNIWTIPVESRESFDILLRKIIETGAKPNIFLG